MAAADARLFGNIFFGNGAGHYVQNMAEFLERKLGDPEAKLQLQVVARHAPIPWASLHVGDVSNCRETGTTRAIVPNMDSPSSLFPPYFIWS
jgi:hypothetical protein